MVMTESSTINLKAMLVATLRRSPPRRTRTGLPVDVWLFLKSREGSKGTRRPGPVHSTVTARTALSNSRMCSK
eukprot:2460584-Rhodomonas_salina.6